VKRLHIIGRKNSGKTTLIEDLLRYYVGRGVRAGSIKHTHHRHELDVPGKDSFRHRQAGAAPVAVLSPNLTAVFMPLLGAHDCDDRYDLLAGHFAHCDIVLVEGDSQTRGKKIEVWRSVVGAEPIALGDPSVLAIVSDEAPPGPASIRVWPRRDIAAIADHLLGLVAAP
jgi:molybdopterin-guanine dinucleotide biosynthesis protein MobB